MRTDEVDGFLLDRGFQVLLTAYPECRRQLDYAALELREFFPGAMVRLGGRFHTVADPWRRPVAGLLGALAPIGTDREGGASRCASFDIQPIASTMKVSSRNTVTMPVSVSSRPASN